MTMDVTILRDRYVRSWPLREADQCFRSTDRARRVPLGEALERAYRTDVHMVAYTSDQPQRLNQGAIGQASIEMTTIVLDIDCPDVHGSDRPAPEAWRVTQRARILASEREHPGVYGYDTRGGLRAVWRLPEPMPIRTREDARRWSQDYAITVANFARVWGVQADPACADWTRLYRMPRATREGGDRPENRPIWGDPDRIGTLHISATHDDMRRAKELSRAFGGTARVLTFRPRGQTVGDGLLYALLAARGDVLGARPQGDGWVIRCPREAEHTCGQTGDGSTILYPPASGERVGAIHCLHGHCAGMTARDWLRLFAPAELAAADHARGAA